MIHIKTDQQINILREGGKRLAELVSLLCEKAKPGVTTKELDDFAFTYITENGDRPAFLNYRPEGASTPFPAVLCISINEQIVHGIPSTDPLQDGDILSIDCGLLHGGMFTDHAKTVAIGKIPEQTRKLLIHTEESLYLGIKQARVNNTTGDIGHAIESFVDGRYGIVRELAGHGVGVEIHEDPYVPNYGRQGGGERLKPGMVIAIEPMLTLGGDAIIVESDDWTISTKDRTLSAHFEHTVAITDNGPEILTKG